MLYHHTVNI